MKENEYSDTEILNEIFDEEPTNPYLRSIEEQLNTATSLGYSTDWRKWTTEVTIPLEDGDIVILEETVAVS
jgi:hypothetical protein